MPSALPVPVEPVDHAPDLSEVVQGATAALRAPTLALRALAERLRADALEPGRQVTALLDQLVQAVSAVAQVDDDLRTVSLHGRGLLGSEPTWCRVEDLVERVGSEHPIELVCHPETMVHVDEAQVRHLLGVMARDAAQHGRALSVLRADVAEGQLCLDVVDLRPSSDPAEAAPAPSEEQHADHHCGLGRSVVRALTAAHGGTVAELPVITGGTALSVRIPQPRR